MVFFEMLDHIIGFRQITTFYCYLPNISVFLFVILAIIDFLFKTFNCYQYSFTQLIDKYIKIDQNDLKVP